MKYQWLSTDFLYYNHLRNNVGYWLCTNGKYFPKEIKAKYDPDKKNCKTCIAENTKLKIKVTIPKTTCANVLHINRKIFI